MSDLSVETKISPRVPADSAGAQVDATTSNSVPDRSHSPGHVDALALMTRLSEGDETAMNQVIERHGNMLARLVGRLTAWSADHEDVFQEVLLHIWQNAGSFRGEGPLGGWLRRLAINRCHNYLRQQNSIRRKLSSLFQSKQLSHAFVTSPQCPNEPSARMQAALSDLTADERTGLVLFYLEEMSGEEVASHLGIKTETLHVRLYRARKKLKTILENEVDA